MKTNLRFLVAFAALASGHAVRAGESSSESDGPGNVRVDVVVDMTPAGKKIVRPTPDDPAYYLPFPMGYKDDGYVVNFQRPPPSADEVQAMMGKVLNQQGYRIMTKQNHPTLVLYYWWGYVAPQIVHWMGGGSVQPDLSQSGGYTALNRGDSFINEAEMLSMVGGETMDDKFDTTDSRKMELVHASRSARWYVLVSAFDFDSWLKNLKEEKSKRPGEKVADQPVLLWRAHISTELWGHYLDEVLPTLITTAGPLLGRETTTAQMIQAPVVPAGQVILGTPEVKDFATKPAEPGK